MQERSPEAECSPQLLADAAQPLGCGPGWSRTSEQSCAPTGPLHASYEVQGTWNAAKAWTTCESWCPGLRSPRAEGDRELYLKSASGGLWGGWGRVWARQVPVRVPGGKKRHLGCDLGGLAVRPLGWPDAWR